MAQSFLQKYDNYSDSSESKLKQQLQQNDKQSLKKNEEKNFFQSVDLLLKPEYNITQLEVDLLKSLGLNTIKGVQMTTRKAFLGVEGVDDDLVDRIKDSCCRISACNVFVTALEISNERKQIFRISTGSAALDKILGGGIESMSITEVFGEFRTGKTQLAHTLCVSAQMYHQDSGFEGGKVMFIDTEQTFRPERIRSIANRFKMNPTEVLANVLCARALNSEHQYDLLDFVAAKFYEEAGVFKLLIIDSIMALFRTEFVGRRELATRQQKIGQMMSRLQKISEEFNIAIFLTNQITSDFSLANDWNEDWNRGKMNNGIKDPSHKPVGGNVLAHASTTRISLTNIGGSGNLRNAVVYDSPALANSEVTFAITTGGIDDPQYEQ